MHLAKFKGCQVGQILKHVVRGREPGHYGNQNIRSEQSGNNLMRAGSRWVAVDEGRIQKRYHDIIERVEANNRRANKRLVKDRVTYCSLVLTLPLTVDRSRRSVMAFFTASLSYLTKVFAVTEANEGKIESNMVNAVIHLDETRPHLHLGFVPVVRGEDGKSYLNAKKAINRGVLKSLHSGLDKYLRANLPGYTGGVLLSDDARVKRVSMQEYKKIREAIDREKGELMQLKRLRKEFSDELVKDLRAHPAAASRLEARYRPQAGRGGRGR